MLNSTSIKWIEAAKQAEENPKSKISCPECGKGLLIVKDEPIMNA